MPKPTEFILLVCVASENAIEVFYIVDENLSLAISLYKD